MRLKPIVYLNYAGVGTISLGLVAQILVYLLHFYFLGPRRALLRYEKTIGLLAMELGNLLNCSGTEVTYLKNTTEGMVIAAEALPLKPGDEVLLLKGEYPAHLIPWIKKRNEGIQVSLIDGRDSSQAFENLIQAITPNTKVISISWVQYRDGFLVDMDRLSSLCAEKNIFLVVDAVQIIGTRIVDLKKTKISILVSGGHKHLRAGTGTGFMYVNQEVLPFLKPYKCGLRSMDNFSVDHFRQKQTASRFEDGTPNTIGILSLYYQVKKLNKIGIHRVQEIGEAYLEYYKDLFRKNHIPFLNFSSQGNMISIPVNRPKECVEYLAQNEIYVRSVDQDFVRISFSPFTPRSRIKREAKLFLTSLRRFLNSSLRHRGNHATPPKLGE